MKRWIAPPVVLALSGVLLTGCGLTDTRSSISMELTSGENALAGQMAIRNVLLVSERQGAPATLLAYISNRSGRADALQDLLINGESVGLPEPLPIPPGSHVSIGDPTGPQVTVDGIDVPPGNYVEARFVFDNAPAASMTILVVPTRGPWAELAPGTPTPTATPTG